MKLRLVLVLGMLSIAGCTTIDPAERRASDEAECRSYGFRPGTDAFAECLQRIDLDRRADARAFRASMDYRHDRLLVYRPIVVRP